MELAIAILVIQAILIYFWNKKIKFYKDRTGKKKILGEFVKYDVATVNVQRNENSTSRYPFVKINQSTDEDRIFKLNYRNILAKEFQPGEKVELFWSYNELLYWNAYDVGLMKYFPKSWFF